MSINDYYKNIRKLGIEYHEMDYWVFRTKYATDSGAKYGKSLDFLLMTVNGIEIED